jgi:hypothetical protein
VLNLLATFVVSGLWHGAGLTFLLWGVYHGLLRGFEELLARRKKVRVPGRRVFTFLLVSAGWVMFRSERLSDFWYIVTHFGSGLAAQFSGYDLLFDAIASAYSVSRLVSVCGATGVLFAVEWFQERRERVSSPPAKVPVPIRLAAYIAFAVGIALFGVFQSTEFVYFRF